MTKKEQRKRIETVVRRLGISGTYQGLECLVRGVALVLAQPWMVCAVTKELYPAIAREVGGTWRTVERNLRTVTAACWTWGDRGFLNEIAGFPLRERPTNGELIDYLAHYIRVNGILEDEAGKKATEEEAE